MREAAHMSCPTRASWRRAVNACHKFFRVRGHDLSKTCNNHRKARVCCEMLLSRKHSFCTCMQRKRERAGSATCTFPTPTAAQKARPRHVIARKAEMANHQLHPRASLQTQKQKGNAAREQTHLRVVSPRQENGVREAPNLVGQQSGERLGGPTSPCGLTVLLTYQETMTLRNLAGHHSLQKAKAAKCQRD